MFYRSSHVVKSDILHMPGISHAFATRSGGVSNDPRTASMNTAVRFGDTPETVRKNIELLTSFAGLDSFPVVYSKQVHGKNILTVGESDTLTDPESREYDGYVTDVPGIALLVRAADCVPILFSGVKSDGTPVIGAAHAGWKGTILGIAPETAERMCSIGALRESIRIAVGPSIGDCCFEVREDFITSVTEIRGSDFAGRHIAERDGKYYASLRSMNTELLSEWGIAAEAVDISGDCTVHMCDVYHSHRATNGMRGTGGGIIGILK